MAEIHSLILKSDSREIAKSAKDLDGLSKSANTSEKSVTKNTKAIGASIGTIAKYAAGIGAATMAMRALTQAISEGIRLYQVQEQAEAKLAATLKATGNAAGFSKRELISFAGELQKVTTFGDEATISMMSVLNTFKNIRGEEYKRTVKAVQDVATVMGQDLSSAALQVAKALNDPIANLGALGRTGIQFNNEQKELIKTLTETNQVAEAQKIILDELESQFGGASEAIAKTATGSITQLSNAYGDVKEQIGQVSLELIEQSGIFEKISSFIDRTSESLNNFQAAKKTVYESGEIEDATRKAQLIANEISEITRKITENDGMLFFGLSSVQRAALEQRRKYLEQQLELLGKTVVKTYEQNNSDNETIVISNKITPTTEERIEAYLKQNEALIKSIEYTSKFNKTLQDQFNIVGSGSASGANQSKQMMIEYYEAIGDYSTAAAITAELAFEKYFPLGEENAEEMAKIAEKEYFKKLEKESKSTFKTIENEWDNLTASMGQSIEDNLFDFMKDGFSDFKGLLKNLGNDILANFTSPIYKGISGSIAGALVPSYAGGGQTVASVASSLGLSLVNGQYSGSVNGTNVVLDTMGNVVSGGNALGGIGNIASMGNTLYNLPSTLGNIGTFMSNPYAGISGLYGNFTGGLYNLGSGISSGLTSLGILGGGATVGSLGGLAGITAGQSLAGAGLTGAGTFINPATMTATSTVAGSAAGAAGAGTTSTLGSSFAAAAPYALAAIAAYGLYNAGWGKKTTVPSGFRLSEDISAGDVDGVESWIQTKTKKWGNSKTYNTYKEASTEAINFIDQTLTTLQYASDSLGAIGDIEIAKGNYASIDKLTESMSKAFLSSVAGIEQFIETEGTRSIREAGEGYMRYVTQTFTQTIENPELTQIYQAWQDYAKAIDSTALEAIQEAIDQVTQTQRSFTAWSLRGDSVELAKYQAQIAQQDAEMIANTLGVNFASLTADNFLDKYNRAVRESFDPMVIQQWNTLAEAFMNATNAQEAYKNAMLQAQEQQYQVIQQSIASIFTINQQILTLENQIQMERLGYTQENLQALNIQSTAIKTIINMAQSMRDSLLGADSIVGAYQSALSLARGDYAAGNFNTDSFDRLRDISGRYAETLKETSLSEQDYKFGVLKIAGEIENITGGRATLRSVEAQIKKVEEALTLVQPTLESQLNVLYDQKDIMVSESQRQIDKLDEMLGSGSIVVGLLRNALSSANNGETQAPSSIGGSYTGSNTGVSGVINDIYTKYDLHQYQTDTSGYEYWANEVTSGNLSLSQLDSTIKKAADERLQLADGGIVTRPTRALIGEAGYPEAVIPLKGGRGLKIDMDGAFKELDKRLERQEAIQAKMAKDMSKMSKIFELADDRGALLVRTA